MCHDREDESCNECGEPATHPDPSGCYPGSQHFCKDCFVGEAERYIYDLQDQIAEVKEAIRIAEGGKPKKKRKAVKEAISDVGLWDPTTGPVE